MTKVTIEANSEEEAIKMCKEVHGWMPDAIREVDSGNEDTRAWMCFESAADAMIWDKQS